jgi:hypothetical protein
MLPRSAAALSAISLVVRLYDAFGVSAGDLASAREITSAILSRAGIDVTWRDCSREDCESPVAPAELVLRVVAAPPASEPGSLGFSYVDVERRSGTLATLFADRVGAMSALSAHNDGELLGRAMAHEIGHLLLGTTRHANRGLMRGRWTTIELMKNRPWDWALSPDEGALMRRALAVRQRRPEHPAAIVARK